MTPGSNEQGDDVIAEMDTEQESSQDQFPTMDESRRNKLFVAVESSYRNLDNCRELNKRLVDAYAGPLYSPQSGASKKYLNMMAQAVDAYTMLLVGSSPQVWMTAVNPELRAFANQFRITMNNYLDSINFKDILKEWVRNSFFSMGIMKIHMADSGELIDEANILMDPGKPFASVISIDDWVHDGKARSWEECAFMGDMYRVSYEDMKSGMFGDADIEDISPSDSPTVGGDERVESISREESNYKDEFEELVDLADIWIPSEGLIYTFAVEDRTKFVLKGKPLAVLEWTGTESGPYKPLRFQSVPENVLPVPPASHWLHLDTLVNNIMRKSSNQSRRSKEVLGYTPQGAGTAGKAKRADDGDMVEMTDPNEMKPYRFGGVDERNHNFMLQTIQLFDREAGNLSSILGLGASTDTVGQEKLVAGARSRMEEALQSVVMGATEGALNELALMVWNDEFLTVPGEVQLQGFPDYRADATWRPQDREGMFGDYKIKIDIYSMKYTGPGERVGVVMQLVNGLYVPLQEMLAQQGGMIDMAELTKMISEMTGQPELLNIIKFAAPPQDPGMMGGQKDGIRKPNTSNRTYTRRNVSGQDTGTPEAMPSSNEPRS